MSKSTPFAREDVMEAYLDGLLKAPEDPAEVTARTAKLLEQASLPVSQDSTVDVVEEAKPPVAEPVPDVPVEETVDVPEQVAPAPVSSVPLQEQLEERFQALFFEVAGLTMAVPLTTLGGIHRLEKIGPLFGLLLLTRRLDFFPRNYKYM